MQKDIALNNNYESYKCKHCINGYFHLKKVLHLINSDG
jgi:hypothetical protein